MNASVSEKGQVTIPKTLREKLGIRPGTVLEFEEDQGRLVARKAEAEDPVAAVTGILKRGKGTDAFIDDIRGAVSPEEVASVVERP